MIGLSGGVFDGGKNIFLLPARWFGGFELQAGESDQKSGP